MSIFYSTQRAAQLAGFSLRHFNRMSIESGNPGLNFKNHFKYTQGMIDKIIEYSNRPKVVGCPKGLARTVGIKVLSGSNGRLID